MDPISLFGIAAGVTFAGYSIGFGIKQAIQYFKGQNVPDSPALTLREVHVIPSTPMHLRQRVTARPPSPIPML